MPPTEADYEAMAHWAEQNMGKVTRPEEANVSASKKAGVITVTAAYHGITITLVAEPWSTPEDMEKMVANYPDMVLDGMEEIMEKAESDG
jgi:hypothetical protein